VGRGLSQREIGRRLGYDHTTINRQLRIHGDPILGPAVATAQIKPSQGQELLQAPPAEQGTLIDLIVARREAGRPISLSELRAAVRVAAEEPTPPRPVPAMPPAPADVSDPPPSSDGTPTPAGAENRELRRMVARAGALGAHIQRELAILRGYRRDPRVASELHRARQLLDVALADED